MSPEERLSNLERIYDNSRIFICAGDRLTERLSKDHHWTDLDRAQHQEDLKERTRVRLLLWEDFDRLDPQASGVRPYGAFISRPVRPSDNSGEQG
jgi:hypothetical protein